MTALLEIAGLSVFHDSEAGSRMLLDGIDLDVGEAETVGVVGESGSGKSMMAKAVMQLLPPRVGAAGSIRFRGEDLLEAGERRMRALRGRSISLLLQDPFTMLDPLVPCGEQVVEGLRLARPGMTRREEMAEAVRRLDEVGIRDSEVALRYPFQLSGGMRQRVAMAAALACNPELLIADEPSTALDVTTQAEILALLRSLQDARGMALLLITHDLRVAFSTCSRVNVFYAGRVLETAPSPALHGEPLHPYALGLLLSEPPLDRRSAALEAIPGTVPRPDDVAHQCAFAARCCWRTDVCVATRPELAPIAPARRSACLRIGEIRDDLRRTRSRAGSETVEPEVTREAAVAPLLEVKNARKEFGARTARSAAVVALNDVSISVGLNESVGIVGESGSGKTTLGRCVVGLESLTAGEIRLDGIDVSHPERLGVELRRRRRRVAQIVFQDPYSSLNPRHTVGWTLGETLSVNGAAEGRKGERIAELLEMVGLPNGYVRRYPRELSGGERQRVAIARALAVEPKLLICDEPVSALDVSVQAQILTLFRDLRSRLGLSYLFITHDLAVVRQVADRVYVMHHARIVEAGPVAEVLDAPRNDYTRRLIASIPAAGPLDPQPIA